MLRDIYFAPSLNARLIIMMLFLSFLLVTILVFIYSQSEKALFSEIEHQTSDLTKAIQIGVEEVTGSGKTDQARLSKYLNDLNSKGVKEISIISNDQQILASTNPTRSGQPLSHRKKELIIKAELGEPVSQEGSAYNVILPVIADDMQYGYIHLQINRDDFSKVLKENTIKRIAATVVVFSIGILLAIILSKQYTRPILRVVEAAERVAAGDLKQSIPVHSRDEIGKLSDTFNRMVHNLREGKALEQRLREAENLAGLGQLSRDMAHEIRNPLNFINLSIDHIAEKYKPGGEEQRDKFANLMSGIKIEIQRLNNLVNNVLDYGKPIRLALQRVGIVELLEDVMSLIWAKAESEGVIIEKEYTATPSLLLDPDLFKSCILNCISNAFHAMSTVDGDKLLHIRTFENDGWFYISVRDTGIGVASENVDKVFEPFFSTKQSGVGLGLPMMKRVAEEHGGRVRFQSEQGKGSTVTIALPLRADDSAERGSA